MLDTLLRCIVLGILLFFLHGCGGIGVIQQDGPPSSPVDINDIPDAVPRHEPLSRYGNPPSYVVFGRRYYVMNTSRGYVERGIASWYGSKFHGKRTSSGETYNMYTMTAAHRSLPLPTYVSVTNLENGHSVVVKVNDRGPFHDNRVIDMSYAAASKLGMLPKGTALVEVKAINPADYHPTDNNYQVVGTTGPIDTTRQFYIQCGAFSDLRNAERLRSRLNTIGAELARISQTVHDGKTVYRVRIGPLADVAAADKIVARLTESGIYDHHIVIE